MTEQSTTVDAGGSSQYTILVFAGVALSAVLLTLVAGTMARASYDLWFAVLLAPAIFFLATPVLLRLLAKTEPDRWIHRAVVLGLAAKLIGAFIRFYVNEYVLGHADASAYYTFGVGLSEEFRQFVFGGPFFQEAVPDFTGTRFMRLVSGVVYVFLGDSQVAGYVIFSFFSFCGLFLFYRAYCMAVPDGLRRRYVVLTFFLPSMVFWPSSIGKEAWMTAWLGVGAYGLARLLTQRRGAYPVLLLALAAMGIVRPHVAAIFAAGVGAAFVLRRSRTGGGSVKKLFGLIVLIAVAGLILNQLQSFFDLSGGLDPQQVFDETTRRSSQGGSQFETVQPTSPIELPWAIITVLLRPFLFEAAGPTGYLTAMEGTVLLALFLISLPAMARLPRRLITQPYLAFTVVYVLIFAFAFSAISNFGILARQRTQLFPVAVVLLTIPATIGSEQDDRERGGAKRNGRGAWDRSIVPYAGRHLGRGPSSVSRPPGNLVRDGAGDAPGEGIEPTTESSERSHAAAPVIPRASRRRDTVGAPSATDN